MADRRQDSLGGRSPLQAATTPNLDSLATCGSCGHMYPIAPGVCPSSDQSLWQVLGYGDREFPGRAGIEAIGAGFDIERGEVVFGVMLATTTLDSAKRYVQVAPAYLPEDQAAEIARALSTYEPEHFQVRLLNLGGPFMAVAMSGGASPMVSDSDPLLYRLPVPEIVPLAGAGSEAARTATELTLFTSWAADVLASHPVNARRESDGRPAINYVLVKWPSTRPELPSFAETWGFTAAAASSGLFCAGLARTLGMEFRGIESSAPGEELYNRLLAARESLDAGFDFVLVQTKAADEASHAGRPARKVRTLEELDLALTAVREHFAPDPDVLTILTAGHTSPSGQTDEVIHSGESVPVVILGRNVRVDPVESLDELSCSSGSLGLLRGRDVMPLVLGFTNRARLGTSRLGPRDRSYRPTS